MSEGPKTDPKIAEFLDARFTSALDEFDRCIKYVENAVRLERERCARIAEESRPMLYCLPTMHLSAKEAAGFAEEIAKKIRSGE